MSFVCDPNNVEVFMCPNKNFKKMLIDMVNKLTHSDSGFIHYSFRVDV